MSCCFGFISAKHKVLCKGCRHLLNHGYYCFRLCVLIWPKARDFLENLKLARIFGSPVVSLRFHRKASRRFKSIKVSADDKGGEDKESNRE